MYTEGKVLSNTESMKAMRASKQNVTCNGIVTTYAIVTYGNYACPRDGESTATDYRREDLPQA